MLKAKKLAYSHCHVEVEVDRVAIYLNLFNADMDSLGLLSSGLFQGMKIVWTGQINGIGLSSITEYVDGAEYVMITAAYQSLSEAMYIMQTPAIIGKGYNPSLLILSIVTSDTFSRTDAISHVSVKLSDDSQVTINGTNVAASVIGIA